MQFTTLAPLLLALAANTANAAIAAAPRPSDVTRDGELVPRQILDDFNATEFSSIPAACVDQCSVINEALV
jgi:hypothetical protein